MQGLCDQSLASTALASDEDAHIRRRHLFDDVEQLLHVGGSAQQRADMAAMPVNAGSVRRRRERRRVMIGGKERPQPMGVQGFLQVLQNSQPRRLDLGFERRGVGKKDNPGARLPGGLQQRQPFTIRKPGVYQCHGRALMHEDGVRLPQRCRIQYDKACLGRKIRQGLRACLVGVH